MLYETACRLAMADEHIMSNYFPVTVGHAGHQWLVSLPANYFDSWQELKQAFIDNFIATCEQPDNKYDLCSGFEIAKMSHYASTSDASRRGASMTCARAQGTASTTL